MSEDPTRKRRLDLEAHIREALDLINEYEEKLLLSDDPKEKRDFERQIADLRRQLEKYQAELNELEASAAQARPPAAIVEGVMPLPPQPYFAHPFPLLKYFTGRLKERQMLTEWLTEDDRPVLALVAIGGMGKSALTWAWLQRDVLGFPLPGLGPDPTEVAEVCRVPEAARPEGVLWWSFYEREAYFAAFLDEALTYASGGSVDPVAIPSTYEKVKTLIALLQERRLLLVMNGFERELRAYAGLSAAYQGGAETDEAQGDFRTCTDPHASGFLRSVATIPMQSRILLTSRLLPRELDDLAGCRQEELTALAPEDAVAFFHAQGVRGTRAEIQDVCAPYGYHPLALRLLAGMIVNDLARPGDVAAAAKYSPIPELVPRVHHILDMAYDALTPPLRELLSRLAAFRSAVKLEELRVLSPFSDEEELKGSLRELLERGLLFFDQDVKHYDLDPIVRQYSYDRLADKVAIHTRLMNYFDAIPAPDEDRVRSLDDLATIIERYHHTALAGRYDEALELYRDHFSDLLYFRFGAYQICIELLRALFPDGEDKPPKLTSESAQAWTMNALANSYRLSGQPRRAVPLFEQQIVIGEKGGLKRSISIGLVNLATLQVILGGLSAAEENLRRNIELSRDVNDEFLEAIGHQELGLLLTYRGIFEEAAHEFEAAISTIIKLDHKQGLGLTLAYRALHTLLMGEVETALEIARQAHEIATSLQNERDFIRAEWLLGAALVALASEEREQQHEHLAEAEGHLTEALTRCRSINLVHSEPDILLAWARWHHAKGDAERAHEHAEEALAIADRSEYRLNQADIHNFLARLALDAGDQEAARQHAEVARERAWCDGPPHSYKPALDEAERMLKEAEEM